MYIIQDVTCRGRGRHVYHSGCHVNSAIPCVVFPEKRTEKFCAPRVPAQEGRSWDHGVSYKLLLPRNSSRTCATSLLTQGPHVTNGRFGCCRCRSRAAAAGCTREQ